MVKRERLVVNGKVSTACYFHSWFHQRSWFSQNHFEMRQRTEYELTSRCGDSSTGVEVIPQGPRESDLMGNFRMEVAVREVTRRCRTLWIPAEHNTSVRIADDSSFFSWLPWFAAQIMNYMRIGNEGKTSELRRTGRRWRKPMAQM